MTSKGYINDFYKQFEEVNAKLDKANSTISQLSLNNSLLVEEVKELNQKLEEAYQKNQELLLEIERLKNNNKKDSSNSGKPSSTNGFKRVITNNREKSNKKKGGQVGHKGKTLTQEEVDRMIKDGQIDEVISIEENKNEFNRNYKPIIKYEYDIKITKVVYKHIIYPDKPTNVTQSPVVYGNNIKSIGALMFIKGASMDSIQSFLSSLTNNVLHPSKSSICNWTFNLGNILSKTEYERIKKELLDSLVLNVDESPIKIDGEQYYIHNISNGTHTLQYVTKHRSMEDIDKFGFLQQFKGIIVHDHYKMYYNYGMENAECNVHVLRYLNGVNEFTKHSWAKKLKELLLTMKHRKEELIQNGENMISNEEYEKLKNEYLKIIGDGYKEMGMDLKNNSYRAEEKSLLNRLKQYANNHLLFLKKFFVPFSNNRAEADLRPIKIRQKIGKFRSIEGANNYAIIRSCASTYSKNNVDLYLAILNSFNENPILI